MNANDFLRSQYLKTDDIPEPTTLTIEEVTKEHMAFASSAQGRPQEKPVLWFAEIDQGLTLNRTNLLTLVQLLGTEDMTRWLGHAIELFCDDTVSGPNGQQGGIRIRLPQAESHHEGTF
jgi:hypothetical protein